MRACWVPEEAARRELVEETGYEAGELVPLIYGQPANGITDSEHFVFLAKNATRVAEPTECNESDRVEWVELDKVLAMIDPTCPVPHRHLNRSP